MVRKYARKSGKGLHDEKKMREAIALVESGLSLRKAADLKQVNYITLYRYVNKKKNNNEDVETMRVVPHYDCRKVFSSEQEAALKEYMVNCAKMCYGLDTVEVRKLAYEMAKFHNLTMPDAWHAKKMAGKDWLYSFRKRHNDLTLRKPEPCSLSRATSFNRHNVEMFFTNLELVLRRHPNFANGSRVFALDETSTKTVQKPGKVIAKKGHKQLNKVTSGERGTLVTTCCAISATGSALPPAMVFPRKTYKAFMINGAPTGTLGLAQPTGWMNSDIFPDVLKHFIKATLSSKENPTLFILDNHESHLGPAVLNIAKDNGVTLLTIPPHTSHRLQPLDVSVFGPLQKYYNAAADAWMMRYPGKTITIYDVAGLLGTAFDRAMTPANIKSGFRKTGIFPFDKDIFNDDDYFPSEVTNRPFNPSNNDILLPQQLATADATTPPRPVLVDLEQAGPSNIELSAEAVDSDATYYENEENLEQVTVETTKSPLATANAIKSLENPPNPVIPVASSTKVDINIHDSPDCSLPPNRVYPKAGPRLESSRGRKRGKSLIATDTPVKTEIENAALKRKENKQGKEKTTSRKRNNKKQKKVEDVKRNLFDSEDDKEAENDKNDSDSSSDLPLSCLATPKEGDFVVVKFPSKPVKHYIGKLLTDNDNDEFDVSYLRKSAKVDNSFYLPLEPDMATVALEDIEIVVPLLRLSKITKRQSDLYTFKNNILRRFNLS